MVDVLIDAFLENSTTILMQITSQHMLSSNCFVESLQSIASSYNESSRRNSCVWYGMFVCVVTHAYVHSIFGYGGLPVMFTQVAVFVQHTSNVML